METLDSMTLDSTINASCGYLNKRWFNQRFTTVARWTESQSSSTSLHFVISTKFPDKKMDITEKWQQLNISLKITEMGTRGFLCPAVTITWVLLKCGQRWSWILTRSLHPRPRPFPWLRQAVVVFADTIDWNTSLHILHICLLGLVL